jgi:hypothetical protein
VRKRKCMEQRRFFVGGTALIEGEVVEEKERDEKEEKREEGKEKAGTRKRKTEKKRVQADNPAHQTLFR